MSADPIPQAPVPEPQPAPSPAPAAGAEPSKDDRTMAMLAHLLALVLGILGPLIIWLIKKDQSAFVDDQGKEALNFQIAVLIAFAASGAITLVTCGFGFPLAMAIWIANIVFVIIGGLKANEGVAYRYPLTLRLIK